MAGSGAPGSAGSPHNVRGIPAGPGCPGRLASSTWAVPRARPTGRPWPPPSFSGGLRAQPFPAWTVRFAALGIKLDGRDHHFATALPEPADVRLPREQELREADPLVLARLLDAKQHEVRGQSGLRDPAIGDLPVVGEGL